MGSFGSDSDCLTLVYDSLYTFDMMSDEIMKKLNEHDEQLEVIAVTVADNQKRLGGVEKRLMSVEVRLDRIEENMATKEDTNKIMNTLDELVGLYRKTEQEQAFMGENVKRNTEALEKIKPLAGLGVTS